MWVGGCVCGGGGTIVTLKLNAVQVERQISFETSLCHLSGLREWTVVSQSVLYECVCVWQWLPATQQMTLIKNENIINSTTLFFFVRVVVGVVVGVARIPLLLLCRVCPVIGCMCDGTDTSAPQAIKWSQKWYLFFGFFPLLLFVFGEAAAAAAAVDGQLALSIEMYTTLTNGEKDRERERITKLAFVRLFALEWWKFNN